MPLDNNKISLIHKVKGNKINVFHSQEVPPSHFLSGRFGIDGVASVSSGPFFSESVTVKDANHFFNLSSFCFSGSLTVEAALVFPIFLFALVGMLFFFRVLQVSQNTYGALAATGSKLALEAEEEVSLLKAMGYFHQKLSAENCSYIVGGRLGIQWSEIEQESEYIDLQIQYKCKLPIQLFYVRQIPMRQKIRIKKWTGYHKETEKEESGVWVYITHTGEVYHIKRECTHLQLSIFTMEKERAVSEGYRMCLSCKEKPELYSYYYVTKDGEKYHKSLACSGLKRTIYMIKLSEIGNRRKCERCGK